MANYISRSLSLGNLKVPIYTPYVASSIADVHWPTESAEHKAAATKWAVDRRDAKKAQRHPPPLNDWPLYHLRFNLASDICGGWSACGGVAARPNRLSIVPHFAETASIGTSLPYDALLNLTWPN